MFRYRVIVSIWIVVVLLLFIMSDGPFGLALLAFSIIVLFLSLIAFLLSGSNISYGIQITEHPDRDEGNGFHIEFIQQNTTIFPIYSSSIDFQVKNITTGETVRKEFSTKNSFQLETLHCGYIEISIKRVVIYDLLNVFRKTKEIDGVHTFMIPPQIKNMDLDVERFDSYDLESYEFSYTKKGDDPSEIFGLKEYEPGDNMKSIHWKLSGKLDELVIKESGFPIDNKTILLLNNAMVSNTMEDNDLLTPEQRSELVELLISLSKTLLDDGLKHTIGWYDYRHNHFIEAAINDINDIWSSIPDILKSEYKQDAVTIPIHFIEQTDNIHYANYLYVTENDKRDIERLEELGEVSIFTTAQFK